MISTVTTSTVSTATAITGTLGVVGILFLVALLIQKEMFSGSENTLSKRINQVLNIAIPPMLIAFALIVLSKFSQFLPQ